MFNITSITDQGYRVKTIIVSGGFNPVNSETPVVINAFKKEAEMFLLEKYPGQINIVESQTFPTMDTCLEVHINVSEIFEGALQNIADSLGIIIEKVKKENL